MTRLLSNIQQASFLKMSTSQTLSTHSLTPHPPSPSPPSPPTPPPSNTPLSHPSPLRPPSKSHTQHRPRTSHTDTSSSSQTRPPSSRPALSAPAEDSASADSAAGRRCGGCQCLYWRYRSGVVRAGAEAVCVRGRGREARGGVGWRGCRGLRAGGWNRGSGRCGFLADWTLLVVDSLGYVRISGG